MDIAELNTKSLVALRALAKDYEIAGSSTMRKAELVEELLRQEAKGRGLDLRGGVLEMLDDDRQKIGFLRAHNYLPGPDDI